MPAHASFAVAEEMLKKRKREEEERDTNNDDDVEVDETSDEETEDDISTLGSCPDCGFRVHWSWPDDHQFCEGRADFVGK